MKIRYEVTTDDILAFAQHYFESSPELRKQALLWRWGGAACLLFLGMAMALFLRSVPLPVGALAGLTGAAYYFLRYPSSWRKRSRRIIRRLHEEGKNRTVVGWHELELHPDAFIERTAYNENRTSWAAVEKVDFLPEHTLIFVGAGLAHVIPHQRILEGDREEFLSELAECLDAGKPRLLHDGDDPTGMRTE